MIEPVEDRLGHDRRYSVDWTKISDEFGYRPEVDFAEGLARTVKWYRENEAWWRPIKDAALVKLIELSDSWRVRPGVARVGGRPRILSRVVQVGRPRRDRRSAFRSNKPTFRCPSGTSFVVCTTHSLAEGQAKLVTCAYGELDDVLVDVRVGSPTYGIVEVMHLSARRGALGLDSGGSSAWLLRDQRNRGTDLSPVVAV